MDCHAEGAEPFSVSGSGPHQRGANALATVLGQHENGLDVG
jgi:hypothetical protein